MSAGLHLDEHKCPVCDKVFLITDVSQWVYKRIDGSSPKYFCSWTCMRKYDKKMEIKRKVQKHLKWMKKVKARAEREQ